MHGTPNEESDLDLLIVVDKSNEKSFERPIAGYRALCGLELISKDLIVQTKAEFEQRSGEITTLEYKVITHQRCWGLDGCEQSQRLPVLFSLPINTLLKSPIFIKTKTIKLFLFFDISTDIFLIISNC